MLKARQVGFTTMEQARDLYHWIKTPGANVVVTCQSVTDHRPVKDLTRNYNIMIDGLKRAGLKLDIKETAGTWVLPSRDESTLSIMEAGASEAAAAKKGRAGTISRLHLTETAFYEYADQTLNALLECVAGEEFGSEIVSESTPNGAHGWFYQQCMAAKRGRGRYKLHFFPWLMQEEYACELAPGQVLEPENTREIELVERHGITQQQLLWYRRKVVDKGQALMDQEYPTDVETAFLASGRLFFEASVTAELLAKTRAPLRTETFGDGTLRIWTEPVPGREYLIAVDTAEGLVRTDPKVDEKARFGDWSTGVIYDRRTGEHVATLRAHLPPWELARALISIGSQFNLAWIAVERNNHGHAVIQGLYQQGYRRIYIGVDRKLGWLTTSASRPMALDLLEDAHRRGFWRSNDRDLLGEMETFIVTDVGRSEAARGTHDDLVMAAAIGWDVICKPQAFRSFDCLPSG